MKKDCHPKYQQVLFVDSSTGYRFVCGSTLNPKETEVFEGKEYPVYYVSISSASHPFFVGGKQLVDTEGRVTRFTNRYSNVQKKKQEEIAQATSKKVEKSGKAKSKKS